MEQINIGLIGTGFMGKAHTIAFHALPAVFSPSVPVVCELLGEINAELAEQGARRLGFRRWTADWRELVNDPAIDVVDICSPNSLHKDIALAAIAAGKHVYCEKPLALNAADSLQMTAAAEQAGIKTLVGFNYAKNPTASLAQEIIASGEIGEIIHFRGTHNEDYLADPNVPYSWRCQRQHAGAGSLGDHCHVIHMAQYLVGDIVEVCGDLQTVIKQRPIPGTDKFGVVENDDQSHFMLRFSGDIIGTIETSRVAQGRKMGLTYEITGTKGSLFFDQERLSELQLYTASDAKNRQGFRTILLGPEHSDYAAFSPAVGHGLGFNDQKIVEVRDLIEAIINDTPLQPDFRTGWKVDRVIEAVERSAREHRWIKIT